MKGKAQQRGIVLLMLVIIIILGFAVYAIARQSVTEIKLERQRITHRALNQAKQALIAYAVMRADIPQPSVQSGRYGYLPCPANNNGDGNSMGSCGGDKESYIGWFPWRSLKVPAQKDGNGDCLLYAVSSTFKFSASTQMLNEDTFGMFQVVDESGTVVHGSAADKRPVAIIFSAGITLPGQNRVNNTGIECNNDPDNYSAYLDTYTTTSGTTVDNATVTNLDNQVDKFIQVVSANSSVNFNDQLLVITAEDIWQRIMARPEFDDANVTDSNKMRRLTESLARCLAAYANDNTEKRLPMPAAANLNGNAYRDNNSYTDSLVSGSHFGRYPFNTAVADSIIPGTVAPAELFDKAFLNGTSCSNLALSYPGGVTANLADGGQERELWNNWKDHIFYAVSEEYEPDSSSAGSCGNCIRVGGSKYAAAVIYSGKKQPGQIRQAPIATTDAGVVMDTKQDPANYIEVINPAGNGMGDYTRLRNDIIFCLTATNPVDVVPCM